MIALYRGVSWLSRMIECFSWSEYSHAAWLDAYSLDDIDTAPVIEAWWPVVRHLPTVHAGHTPRTVVDVYDFVVPLQQCEREAIVAFLVEQIGKRYDWRGVVHFVTRRSEHASCQWRWFCSELAFQACRLNGRELLVNIPAYKVYPGMLAYSPALRKVATVEV